MSDEKKQLNEITPLATVEADGEKVTLVSRYMGDDRPEELGLVRTAEPDAFYENMIESDERGRSFVVNSAERVARAMKGPAKVNSSAYRTGWDAIFNKQVN